MPTDINRRPQPAARREIAARGSGDASSSSLMPLAIVAFLVVTFHVAAAALLGSPKAHASMAAPDAACADNATPAEPSLPFD